MRKYSLYAIGLIALAATVALVAVGTAGGSAHKQGVSGKLSFIGKWTGEEEKSFEAVLEPFKKANPDVEIKYTGAGDNVPQIVSTAVAGGNPPDLSTLPQPGLMKQFAQRKAAKPITFAKSTVAKNYLPIWLRIGTVNGKLYGIFFKGTNKSTVWYNTKAFKAAGVKTPTTFNAFLKTAKTIRASGAKAYSIGASDGWTLTDLFENIYIRVAGPQKYDLLTAHKIKWTDPSVKAALRVMAKIVGDTGNIAGGRSGALQTDFNTSVSNVFSDSPKAVEVIEADFVPGVVKHPLKPISGYNEFPFPSIKPATKSSIVVGGDIVVMYKDSPAARALVNYLATPKAATIWVKRGGFSSPSKNVKASDYPDSIGRRIAIPLAHAKNLRFDMSDLQPAAFGSTSGQGEWKLFQDFVSNPSNVNGIAAKLEAAAAKAYKK